jgi:NTE family protein
MSRPEIGLALGGGVARGWVHIGVLKALIKAGIEPDVMSGTSIGAVVGGLYLSGKLGVLEQWARALTSRSIFNYLDFNWGGNSPSPGIACPFVARQFRRCVHREPDTALCDRRDRVDDRQ